MNNVALYQAVSRISKGIACPSRLAILDLLCHGEKPVDSIARGAGISVKLASAQLRELRSAKLVQARRDGKRVRYRVDGQDVIRFWVALRALAEARVAELEDSRAPGRTGGDARRAPVDRLAIAPASDRAAIANAIDRAAIANAIDREALLDGARAGRLLVIDVRPSDEFEAGHFPGARSFPFETLEDTLDSLPRDREIVAYCRGPYCALAGEAVSLLKRKGFRASRFAEGVPEWVASGLSIAYGNE